MKQKTMLISVGISLALTVLASGIAMSAQDRYSLRVPGGLAFSEFRGYESWQVVGLSNGGKLAVILGNQTMIDAYRSGIPVNGKPFPDGAKMAKIHWNPKKNPATPGQPLVPDTLHDIDFMVKDSKRFADSGGWGYAVFEYDPASDTFRPGNATDQPPQANDAKCGASCHTAARQRDFVFTEFPQR
jgi:Cytochrome P460